MGKRAIGYIRVSSVGGRSGPGYHTLEIQRASIERTAAFHQYELVETLTDEDASSKTRDRPQFNRVRERLVAGDADAVIVWKVSRFSRSWRQAAEDVELLLDNGMDLLSEEGFDTKTAGGRLLLRILFSMAEWEHDVLGEHWETIKGKAVRDRGSWLGVPPLGYSAGPGGVLEPNGDKRCTVALFKARAAGESWGDLAARLDVIRPRPSGARHDLKDVRRIIQSRVYLGETRWRDQINTDAHSAIISPELWQAANRVTDDRPRTQNRVRLREFPLTGWLRCCGCEGPMSGSTISDPRGVKRGNYICSRRHGGCERPQSISADAAERWALDEAQRLHEGLRVGAAAVEKVDADALRRRGDVEAALHELGSVDARRDLGEDWLPMMRRLRAEKAAIDQAAPMRAPERAKSWDDLDGAERWERLRSIATLGALVGPARGRGRHGRPADRLRIIEDTEGHAVLRGEVPT